MSQRIVTPKVTTLPNSLEGSRASITDKELKGMRDNFEKYYYVGGEKQKAPTIKINWNEFKNVVDSVPGITGSTSKKGVRFFYCYDEVSGEFYLKMQVGFLEINNSVPIEAPYSFIFSTNEQTPYFEIEESSFSKAMYPAIPYDHFDDGYFNSVEYSEIEDPSKLNKNKHAHSILFPWEYEIKEMVDQNDTRRGGDMDTLNNPNLSLVIYFCVELEKSSVTKIFTQELAFGLYDELLDITVPYSSNLKGSSTQGVFNNRAANFGGPCNPVCATSPTNAYVAPDDLNSIIEKIGY